MSSQTDLFCRVTFLGKTYNHKYEVEGELTLTQKAIKRKENVLRDLAIMTEPEKWYDKENFDNPYEWVTTTLKEQLEDLACLYDDEVRLGLLLDNWELCHDKHGLAIAPPWGCDETAYLDGDFVRTNESESDDE